MPTDRAATTALPTALRRIVGDAHVLTDPATTESYRTDWTGRWRSPESTVVVRPADTAQTAAVVAACADARVPVTPQGGNTGLVGGAQPSVSGPSVILSTRRMAGIGAVDTADRCIPVGAGAVLADVRAAARKAGLTVGVDLAARDSATIGGMVATNAGGVHVIRYGSMRAQVLGIEAVTAAGHVFRRWRPLRKDNVGYDLPGLLAGSEGTLAVITAVLVRLVVPARRTAVAVVGVNHVADAQRVVAAVEASGAPVHAAELMTATGLGLVGRAGARNPLRRDVPYAVLVECAGTPDLLAEVLDEQDRVLDAAVEPGPAHRLWAVRERHTEVIAEVSQTPVVKLDVTVPSAAMSDLVAGVERLAADLPDSPRPATPVLFGHVGDGNLHVNIVDVPRGRQDEIVDAVLRLVDALGGSISAEHGVGRAKRAWIELGRDAVDLAMMRAVKGALDPDGLFNPGAVLA
ncbi:FAD-binding oxidoreductase [Gordonia shandongensis]|uniref:FAD-binding oxidoreductase n=1 Tax=Gordonia shandongensis TaxID=376351 RepID=UPI00040DEE6E|nr:FAD-binding oxidoreductase [Gordonia shandongensis]